MHKIKNNSILILSILFLLATVSAKYSYTIETMFSSLLKYGITILIICLTVLTAAKPETENKLMGKHIQLEWMFLFAYGMLLILQHQVFSSENRLALGISMGVANGMQKLAALFIGCYILKSGNKNFCRAIIITFLIIILMDAITTLQAVQIDDQALREASMGKDGMVDEEIVMLGVANVNHIFSYITCIPIMFILIINQKSTVLKLIMIAILLTLIVAVVNAGFTMAMTIMAIAMFLLLSNSISKKPAVKLMFVIVVLFLVLIIDWAQVILFVGSKITNPSVKQRLSDLYNLLEFGSQGDALSSRTSGYIKGLEGFLQSPIIGNIILDSKKTSGHSTIIDIMSNWGLIGITVYLGYLINMFKASVSYVLKKDTFYVVIAALIFAISYIINPVGGYVNSISVIAIFFSAAGKLVYLNTQNEDIEIIDEKSEDDIELRKSCIK